MHGNLSVKNPKLLSFFLTFLACVNYELGLVSETVA